MLHKRVASLVVVVVLLGLLTGCAAAPGGSADMLEGLAPQLESFSLRLPRMYVLYVENGGEYAEPSVWGMRASQLESWFGLDLSMVKIPQFYMDWLKASNVQHVEVVHEGSGMYVYVNGEPTPYVAWDAESMGLVSQLMEPLGVPNGALIGRLLPLLRRIGLDIVVQMPLAPGADVIAYRNPEAGLMASDASAALAEPAAELKLSMSYDANGVPSFLGLSAALLQPMVGATPGQLDPQLIGQLKAAGVERLGVQIRGDGLYIFLNDQALPNVAWSEDHLGTALDLYAEMNATSWVPNPNFVYMVRELVTQVTNSDVVFDVILE